MAQNNQTGTPRTTQSKALIPAGAIDRAIERLADPMFKDALSDISVFDLPRYTVGAGNSITFANGEKEAVGVIIKINQQRVFWGASSYGAQARPICVARDGLHGEPDPIMVEETGINPVPGGSCLQCPYAEFGSMRRLGVQGREQSRASACSAVRHVFLFPLGEEHSLPIMIKAAPSSLKNLRRYQVELMDRWETVADVVTSITIEAAHSSGFDFGALRFRKVASLDDATKAQVRVYAQQIAPWLEQAPLVAGEDVLTCPDCAFQWVAPPADACPSCGVILG